MEAQFIGGGDPTTLGLKHGYLYPMTVRILNSKNCTKLVQGLNRMILFDEADNNDIRGMLNLIIDENTPAVCTSDGCFPIHQIVLEVIDSDGLIVACQYNSVESLFDDWNFVVSRRSSVKFVCDGSLWDNQCFFLKHKKILYTIGVLLVLGILISEMVKHSILL